MSKIILTLALAGAALWAQAPAPPPPLVRLYPVVMGANGEPVTDLTAADFKIVDQTKPETIYAFHKPPTEANPPLAQLEFSNRPAGRPARATVVLFDMLNMNQPDRLDTWKELDKTLPQLESGESVYFYLLTLEGALVPIHAIGPKSADDKTWPQSMAPAFDKAMKSASHGRAAQMGTEEEVKKTFKAIEDLAGQLAAFPGRRDILWITSGVPSVWDPKNPKCKSLDFDAYKTFSSTDKTGTIPNAAGGESSDIRMAGTGNEGRTGAAIGTSGGGTGGDWIDCGLYVAHLGVTLEKDAVMVDPISHSRDLSPEVNYDLEQMARLTGGHNYFKMDIRTALQQVGQGTGQYEVDYDPTADNWDNKFHKIQITCSRPGVKVQARERYYAVKDSRPPVDRMKGVLMAAYQSPSDASEIGLRTKIGASADAKGVHMEIRVNSGDVLLREQNGKFSGAMYLLISDRGPSGPLGEPTVSSFNLDLTPAQHDAVVKEGIPLIQDHPTTDAVQQVRIIVLDQNTNEVGSLTFPVR